VVLPLVSNYGFLFRYASERLRGNAVLAVTAAGSDAGSLAYAADWIRIDATAVLAALRSGDEWEDWHECLEHVAENAPALLRDKNFMLAASQQQVEVLEYADGLLLSDHTFLSEVAQVAGTFIVMEINMLSATKSVKFALGWNSKWQFHGAPVGAAALRAADRDYRDRLWIMEEIRYRCDILFELTEDQSERFELLLGTTQLPRDWPMTTCPGMVPGKLLQLQLLI